MTRKERLLAAARRRPVDRVPYATYNFHPYVGDGHVKEPTYAALLERVRTTAGAFIKAGAGGVGEALSRPRPDRVSVVIEGTGDARTRKTTLHTPKGDIFSLDRIPENKPGMCVKALAASDEEVEKYMSIPYEPPVLDLNRARAIKQAAGDRAIVTLGFREPMYSVAALFDFEDFCIRCITDLSGILRIIDWACERCEANMKLLLQVVGQDDFILHAGGPEVCTPPLMPPALFSKLVTPGLSKLIGMAHDAGRLAAIHCHGHVREVFPEIIRTGADLLEPVEPPLQGNISIAELMEQSAGRICLMGHIQDQEFYTAAPGFMTQRVEAIARVVNGRTGYIMSPTCTPFQFPCSDIYQRNYMEWLEAAERLLA